MGSPTPGREERFWHFVYERQMVFERRRQGTAPPWTQDQVLQEYRFTNVYRAADRVSQFLINRVLYAGSADPRPEEQVFRALLFKLFNLPMTYRVFLAALGHHPNLASWDPDKYAGYLDDWVNKGGAIWNNAYMITPPFAAHGGKMTKHRAWLHTLNNMVQDHIPRRISIAPSMQAVYGMLHRYPTVGEFFAYQWTVDINYSTATNFDENSFVVPGLGSIRGAQKLGWQKHETEGLIRHLTAKQVRAFTELHLDFPWLGGHRRLHLIDVQNCLCEFDKYSRVAYPEWTTDGTPKKPKQRFDPAAAVHEHESINYVYPPKWGLGGGERQ